MGGQNGKENDSSRGGESKQRRCSLMVGRVTVTNMDVGQPIELTLRVNQAVANRKFANIIATCALCLVGSVLFWMIVPRMFALSLAVGIPFAIGLVLAIVLFVWTAGSNELLLTADDVILRHEGPTGSRMRRVPRKSIRSITYLGMPAGPHGGSVRKYLALLGDQDKILLSVGGHAFDPQEVQGFGVRLGVPVVGSP